MFGEKGGRQPIIIVEMILDELDKFFTVIRRIRETTNEFLLLVNVMLHYKKSTR